MEQKPTGELNELLKNTSPNQISAYLKTNEKYLVDEERAFYYYFTDTLKEKRIKLKDVYLRTGISESYGSKIISGIEKHSAKRDLIIRLCIAGHFSVLETNRALKLYGLSELYAKDPRDACIIVALNNRIFDPDRIDEILEENNLEKQKYSRDTSHN